MESNTVILEGNTNNCTKDLGKLTSVLSFGTEFKCVALVLGEKERYNTGLAHFQIADLAHLELYITSRPLTTPHTISSYVEAIIRGRFDDER